MHLQMARWKGLRSTSSVGITICVGRLLMRQEMKTRLVLALLLAAIAQALVDVAISNIGYSYGVELLVGSIPYTAVVSALFPVPFTA